MGLNAFNQFLVDHPVWSFAWELFKGVIPTGVAIGAITINNTRAKKRDKTNKQKDILLKWCFELLDYISSFSTQVNETSKAYLDIMDSISNDESNGNNVVFKKKRFQIMDFAIKIKIYSKTLNEGMGITVNLSDISMQTENYITSLIEIKEKYRGNSYISTDQVKELKEVNDIIRVIYDYLEEKSKEVSVEIIKIMALE